MCHGSVSRVSWNARPTRPWHTCGLQTEFLLQQLADEFGRGTAARFLHDLALEESERLFPLLAAGLGDLDRVGIGGDGFLDEGFNCNCVLNLFESLSFGDGGRSIG